MPKGGKKAKELFTASEVARFCQVDLKTIHNWADRGEIRHFRTPGRHLRFRRVDVLDFLRRYGYPIPDVLKQGKPRVALLDDDAASARQVHSALSEQFEVSVYENPIEALLRIGAEPPDVVVLEETLGAMDGPRIVSALQAVEVTRHVRAVLYSTGEQRKQASLDAGASAHVAKGDTNKLRATLQSLMGIGR